MKRQITGLAVMVGVAMASAAWAAPTSLPNIALARERERVYQKALMLLDSGQYEQAHRAFVDLNGFKDSWARAEEVRKAHPEAFRPKVGGSVWLGHYEQDNNRDNGKEAIEWTVLEEYQGCYLLISRHGLDSRAYHSKSEYVTWEPCELRRWLNSDFLKEAFDSAEQTKILEAANVNENNPKYNTPGGNSTKDRVFLLSIGEAKELFESDEARRCRPTAYAVARGAAVVGTDYSNSGCGWWRLRSPGDDSNNAAFVHYGGGVFALGLNVLNARGCVRPAVWVSNL